MSKLIKGSSFDIGQRKVYEDRSAVGELQMADGRRLTVALVADGVGGENKGERAAQLAIDTAVKTLKDSKDVPVPVALQAAARAANEAVYDEVQRLRAGNMACTLAMAAVTKDDMLYIANLGDSRIYLCRGKKLTQLSRDHVNAKGALVRAAGIVPDMEADIGFYVNTTDEEVAAERGMDGLKLKRGDSVLVCSDGLVKPAPTPPHTPFVTDEEVIRVLRTKEGENAARTLVAYALGRNADDNVTVALIQTPDPARRSRERLKWGALVAGLAVMAVVALVAAFGLFRTGEELTEAQNTATAVALAVQGTNTAQTATQVVILSYTPTPSPTATPTRAPLPTLQPGQVGFWRTFKGDRGANFAANEPVQAGENLYAGVPFAGGSPGSFYLKPASSITFTSIFNGQMNLILAQGSNVFLQTGSYANGAALTLQQAPGVQLFVSGSCLAAYYRAPAEVAVSCYEGACGYATTLGGARTPISQGQQVVLNTANPASVIASAPARIPMSEADGYRALLAQTGEGQADIAACEVNRYTTPPPTRTPLPTLAPATALPTPTPGGQPQQPTQPPQPPSQPQPSQPPPTAVPPRPTDPPPPTAVPPTDPPPPTAVPPTDAPPPTSEPPTDPPPPTSEPPTDPPPPTTELPTDAPPEVTVVPGP